MFCCIKKRKDDILFCKYCNTFFFSKKQYKEHILNCKKKPLLNGDL